MPSYFRTCKTCGRRIQIRQMPYEQWVAFEDDGSDTPHDCGTVPTRRYSIPRGLSPVPVMPKGQANPRALFDDLDFPEVTVRAGQKPKPVRNTTSDRKTGSLLPPTISVPRPRTPPPTRPKVEIEKRRREVRPNDPLRQTLIVSPGGSGNVRTIGEAIRLADSQTCIVVRPGTYREVLEISRPVELLADTPGTVIVEMARQTCLRLSANARVVGIAFRVSERQTTNYDPAVEILSGRPVLEECEFISLAGSGILILNKGSDPVIRRCTIRGCTGAGVMIDQNSRGTLKDNEIVANEKAGVWITMGADPVVQRNRIHSGHDAGILVTVKGRGKVLGNDVYDNRGAGLLVRSQGAPVVRDSTFRNGHADGIVVKDGGLATIEGCQVAGNEGSGLQVLDTATAHVRKCRINRNKSVGVWLSGGFGWVRECDLTGNQRGARLATGPTGVEFGDNRE